MLDQQHSAIRFNPTNTHLTVATTSNLLYLYNISANQLINLTQGISTDIRKQLTYKDPNIRRDIGIGIAYFPQNPQILFYYGHRFICRVNISLQPYSFHIINDQFYPILFLDFVSNGDMVIVERPFVKDLQNVPPPFRYKKWRNG